MWPTASTPALLYFEEDEAIAIETAAEADLRPLPVRRHRFPDGELRLQLPTDLPARVVVWRGLQQPNEKLVELLLLARTAHELGALQLTLVAPYLAYMRQDMAFNPGEAVSQRVIGRFLASLFDAVITVDPHLHRVDTLRQAVPARDAIVISGAPLLADLIATQRQRVLLIGPDEEALQWVAQAAARHGWDHGVCRKTRHGDRQVDIELPALDVAGRTVVLIDDVISSGHTVAQAARQLRAAGAASVDVAVTHALFAAGAMELLRAAGVDAVWSTNAIAHPSNAVSIVPSVAQTLGTLLAA